MSCSLKTGLVLVGECVRVEVREGGDGGGRQGEGEEGGGREGERGR